MCVYLYILDVINHDYSIWQHSFKYNLNKIRFKDLN